MAYLTLPSPSHPHVDGAILQAPVSDRESMLNPSQFSFSHMQTSYDATVAHAKSMLSMGDSQEIIPRSLLDWFTTTPCTAERFLSLASPDKNGAEDFFSSDLSDDQLRQTFGKISAGTKLCVLYSGSDEHVPAHVDKEGLVRKWIGVAKGGGTKVDVVHSGIVKGANHSLEGCGEEVLEEVVGRVNGFLKFVEGGSE